METAIKLSVTASSLGDDIRQAPRLSRTLGFAGILFDAISPALNLTEFSASARREFLNLLSAQDQRLVGLQIDLGNKGLAPGADVDRALARLNRTMEAAAALGSPLVCVEVGPLPQPAQTSAPKPRVTPDQAGLILLPNVASAKEPAMEAPAAPPDPAFVSQVQSALAEIGAAADRYSVILAFRSELASFAALEAALRAVSCPWFGVDLDPSLALRDEWEMDEIFSRQGGLIRHLRARDAVGGADRRTKPAVVGHGDVQWPQLLANLDAAGYRGWITVDPVDLPNRTVAASEGRKQIAAALDGTGIG
jgi:sugar phosphate isomerase/epimerase